MTRTADPSRNASSTLEAERTRYAFNAAAPVYDAAYEGLRGIQRIRRAMSGIFLQYFPGGSHLLELNCGTGNDAVFLARHGMHILATDLSDEMVRIAAEKCRRENVERDVTPRCLSFDELGTLRGMLFDGVYSNLGGLNCTNRLHSLAADLGGLVKPGGYCIAAVMPSVCMWESAAFLARFRFRDAFRRLSRTGTPASLHGGTVQTYYHSPRKFRDAFSPFFRPVRTIGLSVFTPPPNSQRAYARLGEFIWVLEKLDDLAGPVPPFNALGDHYAIVLRRTAS